ncbi:glycoside hydrolase family 15 protein [Cryobacterium sp. TMT1-66-1]|uniref:glycoside hydrolase family 15 protein n=1 Tax=Cryobacterium sp. TMT1-66-1 TaxID=1259242 RepID=UPI00106D7995|nr:glycoside hydrolase family 15 protein [Cryobacterium sp. TMT1-66-1]TFD08252.1 glycoside hydrolase family 15 protein [Cryobacterium sp. TMT1-66-1]
MALNIEDYALISDCHSAALVGRDGSIDWLCLPRYDSASLFGALLGDENHGRWLLAPADTTATAVRSYQGDTFVLSTVWTTATGQVEVLDFMPHGDGRADLVRRVRGISGTVQMVQDLRFRFGYATTVPWVRQLKGEKVRGLVAIAGPDAIVVRGPQLRASDHRHVSHFELTADETVDAQMTWYPSHREVPPAIDIDAVHASTCAWWQNWASSCSHEGPLRAEVVRSLLVLRALTHEQTGGIVAAATTSLPEQAGGTRNWDYRYVWLRDASLTLEVLLSHGYEVEADGWRAWLLRAIAGDPCDVQIMYGLSGERYLPERELTSLPGYDGASPVRVGNGAVDQFQSDVIGEVMVALHAARAAGVQENEFSWPLQRALMGFLEKNWRRADQGIWEVRGQAREFTHSRVMVWAAFDRAVRGIEEYGLDGPLDRWKTLRDEVRADIESSGFDVIRNSYVQYYGSTEVDASLLVLPQVGFCAPTDPRMLGTVAAIEADLSHNGLLLRYRTRAAVDGLPPGEHPFLACSFWLVEQYAASGRLDDATALMDTLLGFVNDVGLLSEEYDVTNGHQMGNTPQALSHLALVRAADAIMAGRAASVLADSAASTPNGT